MLTASLAALSAALYGVADFLGGFASRKDAALLVTIASQLVGWSVLLVVTIFLPPASWTDPRILWGLGAGIFGGGGVLALYAGLATGRMSVVGPIAAALTGAIPAALGIATGAPLRWTGIVGMILALVAVVIVSMFAQDEEAAVSTGSPRTAILFAVAAGMGFGVSVICFSQTPASTNFTPLLLARTTTVLVLTSIALVRGGRILPNAAAGRIALATGFVDAGANITQVVALRIGPMALAAVIGAMYPVVTVLLARVVLKEHLRGWQRVGVVLALIAVVLSAIG